MNPTRRILLAWSLVQLAITGTACSTAPQITRQRYQEKVSTVLITQDRKQFVILGERHHYIFTAPPDLVALLASPLHELATAQFDPFCVQVNGDTAGRFHLSLPATLDAQQAAQAKAMDFVQQADGSWLHEGELVGKRYIQNYTVRTGRLRANLAHTYEVSVEADETVGEKAAQELASPIAQTADGMLMVYFAVLIPVLIPFIFLTREKRAAPGAQPASAALGAAAGS